MSACKLVVTRHVRKICQQLLRSGQFPACTADSKLSYLVIRKHHRKWVTGDFTVMKIEASDDQKMNDDHIAALHSGPEDSCVISVIDRVENHLGYCRSNIQMKYFYKKTIC